MKTRNLLIPLSVAALAAVNLFASDAVLSPRAAEQQPKIISGVNNDSNLVTQGLPSTSPRLSESQSRPASRGTTAEAPALNCARHMAGTPKMVDECAQHPGALMSCCSGAVAENR